MPVPVTMLVSLLAAMGPQQVGDAPPLKKEDKKGIVAVSARQILEKRFLYSGIPEFSPDGSQLAIGCTDGVIRLLAPRSGKELKAWKTGDGEHRELTFIRITGALLSRWRAPSRDFACWDLKTGQKTWIIEPHLKIFYAHAVHPEGKVIATSGLDMGQDHSIKIWEAEKGTLKDQIPSPTRKPISELAFSPDGKRLAFCLHRIENMKTIGDIVLWDLDKKRELRTIKGGVSTPALFRWLWFTAGGKHVVAADITQTINVWDCESGTLVRRVDEGVGKTHSYFRSYSPQAHLLASSLTRSDSIHLVSVTHPDASLTLKERYGPLALSPDGKLLANMLGGTLRVWEIEQKVAKAN